ncbi:MAG: hypothetical protein ACOX3T_06110 [Bdellovibrionota bacterium]
MNRASNDNNWALWSPLDELSQVSTKEIIYSKGFLQSNPATLFPSFSSFWQSFFENYSFDIALVDIKKSLTVPDNISHLYKGMIDREHIYVGYEDDEFSYLGNIVIPAGDEKIIEIIMEYMTRRLLASLSFSWTASENSIIYFDGKTKESPKSEATIVLDLKVSGKRVNVYIMCPYTIVNTIDKLWKGQIQASSKYREVSEVSLGIQIAELAVSPAMLNDYLSSGVRVGLEKIVNDNVYITKDNKKFLKGRLVRSSDRFVVEILGGIDTVAEALEGMVNISIQLGSVLVPGYVVSEISQKNVLWDTGLEITNEVEVYADNKLSAHAVLASYDKQFAIEVK